MNSPRYYLFIMFIFVCAVALVCALLYLPLEQAFMSNWGFNSIIIGVLIVGLMLNVRRVITLGPELNWMKIFRTGTSGLSVAESPELLKPLAKHLEGLHRDRFSLSALSLRTVLEGIQGRLDESREISRYLISLLVFLGLLGTFWGLLGTIGSVGGIIGGLDVGEGNYAEMFQTLKTGLQEPLQGMGTAFSSSLFGLGGSLILGFIDIQANHAQNRFFNELEEWLSGVTQLVDQTVERDLGSQEGFVRQEEFTRKMTLLIQGLHRTNQHMEDLLLKKFPEPQARAQQRPGDDKQE